MSLFSDIGNVLSRTADRFYIGSDGVGIAKPTTQPVQVTVQPPAQQQSVLERYQGPLLIGGIALGAYALLRK